MNEVRIREPIWNGDRTEMFVGIARFRLMDDMGRPKKGNIKIWIDYKVIDKNDPEKRMTLMYKYPFVIKCDEVIQKYKIQVLNDYKRTRVYIIPIKDLKIYKTRRKRTMTSADFKLLTQASNAVKQESEYENRD